HLLISLHSSFYVPDPASDPLSLPTLRASDLDQRRTAHRSRSPARHGDVHHAGEHNGSVDSGLPSEPAMSASVEVGISQTPRTPRDRKSTRLNSSAVKSSYAVFCLTKT